MPSAQNSVPSRASVVVIGGGVMGCSVLYHLAKFGAADCVLLEQHKLSAGTTWHSAAQVRTMRSGKNLCALAKYAAELYPRLESETGQSAGWINTGALSVAASPDRLIHIKRQKAIADMCGVRAEMISPAEAKEKFPLLNINDISGAVWSPDDGRVGPTDLCAALIKGARAAGAKVLEETTVRGIILQNGKVAGVETSRGEIRCDAIAVCAGLWSREVAAAAGANAQLWPCEHYYLLTRPFAGIARLPVLADHDSHLYLRDEAGGLLVGCFEPHARAVSDLSRLHNFAFSLLPEDWEHFSPMMENALHRVPELANAEIKTLANGPESFTPDGKCLLGETRETPGLFLGCGMNSVGVVSGAGAGRALAEIILRNPPAIAMPEADPKRFPDCWNSAAALCARAPETLGTTYDIHYPGWQMRSARDLWKLPLHEVWQKHGAHFGQMFGRERPLYFNKTGEPELTFARPAWFAQVGEEVRRAQTAGVFDLSAFGMISVRGADAETFLNRICANDMTRPPGRVMYTALLNEHGGMEGDLTAMRFTAEHYLLYTGAGETGRDLAHLRKHLRADERVRIEDETGARAVFGLFGENVGAMRACADLNRIAYFHHAESEIAGCGVRAARLSFVGEFGWEISCATKDADAVYETLAAEGAQPAGWYALNSMRIEKRFLAYYRDLDPGITPPEAGLEFAVRRDKNFIGKDAPHEPAQKIVSVVLQNEDAEPLGDEPVYDGERICGRTTSAAFGYRVQKPVALALINRDSLSAETVAVEIAGVRFDGKIIDGAAFDPAGARMKIRA